MKKRCLNPRAKDFKWYGGRGITVCERWLEFEKFAEDMRGSWEDGLTLERVDVNRGYEPGNCVWIERKKQALNKRNNVRVASPWGVLPKMEVARRVGISVTALEARIERKWPDHLKFSSQRFTRWTRPSV